MAEIDSSRPWVPQELIEFYAEHAARYLQLASREFESEVENRWHSTNALWTTSASASMPEQTS